ncbi:MAG: MGMT family protein [Friedmanniella sp.]
MSAPDAEAYVEAVLQVVEQIPAGRVASYGDVAEAVGRGGPRQVGQVMALHGGAVPWWRVVRADGSPARGHEQQALERLRAEGTPLHGPRVVMRRARGPLSPPMVRPDRDAP